MFNGFYLYLVFLLALFGFLARFGCREAKRPWLVTVLSILVAAGLWVIAQNAAAHGSEGNMVLAAMAACFAAGTLLGELLLLLRHVVKKWFDKW